MSTNVKQGHYVPASYLREFTDPTTAARKYSQLWAYAIQEKRWFKTRPENVAKIGRYYSQKRGDGEWSDSLDRHLSDVEGRFQTVLRDKVLKWKPLSDEDRVAIAMFVALQWMRVPAQHIFREKQEVELYQMVLGVASAVYKQQPDSLQAFKEGYRQRTGRMDLDGLSAEDLNPDGLELRMNRTQTIKTMLCCLGELAEPILLMHWAFALAPGKRYYITSDNPFFIGNPTVKPLRGPGLIQPDAAIAMPLTRNLAFVAGWKIEEERPWVLVDEDYVRTLNLLTAANAEDYLFAPSPDFVGADELGIVAPTR